MPVQYSHLTGPLVGAKREKFDVYWFIGPLCILRQVLTFDLTNKMLMHVIVNWSCDLSDHSCPWLACLGA